MKRKIIIGALMILACFIVTGCGCSKREFTVSFDSRGGSAVSSQIVKKGEKAIKPTDPTRENYTFEGWYLSIEDNIPYDFDDVVEKDITLYAKWSSSGEKCNITCQEGYTLDEENCSCVKNENEKVEVTGISVSKTSLTMALNSTTKINASVRPTNATDKTITWKSNNTKVVTVDQNGNIKAVGVGTAKVTVTAGGKTVTITITVKTQDQINLENALASMNPKTLTKGNTNINDYTATGCSIVIGNVATNSGKTTYSGGVVGNLYRSVGSYAVDATYTVTCGSESATKTLNHVVETSPYRYEAKTSGVEGVYKIVVNDGSVTDFKLIYSDGSDLTEYVYQAGAQGAQVGPNWTSGRHYDLTFNNDLSTIYEIIE